MAKNKNKKNNNKNVKTKQTKKESKNINLNVKGSTDTEQISKVFKYLLVVVIIFVVVYFLTDYITNHSSDSNYKTNVGEATIQSDKILAGSTFNQKEDEYYVLFYNVIDNATYTDTYSTYKTKEDHIPIYYVDTHEGLNRDYVGEDVNEEPTDASEIKVNGPTLMKIENKEVVEFITDEEEIKEKLS